MKTYEKLHPKENTLTKSVTRGGLDASAMSRSAPPDKKFLFLLPLTIIGYNLREKKWGEHVFTFAETCD